MRTLATVMAASFLGLLAAGCAGEPADPAEPAETSQADIDAIGKLADDFVAAANSGDLALVAAFYAADAVLMPPNQPATKGAQAIQSALEVGAADFQLALSVDETAIAGDWAFSSGAYTLMEGEEPTEIIGKWLNVLRRQADGSWKIHRSIWNNDFAAETGRSECEDFVDNDGDGDIDCEDSDCEVWDFCQAT